MKMVVAVSDWPESMGKTFDVTEVKEHETYKEAIERGKALYGDDLEMYVVERAAIIGGKE